MASWTVLGSVINPTSATEVIEYSVDSLPRTAGLRLGIMTINDYNNDATGFTGVSIPTNGFRLGNVILYQCP